MRIGIIGGTGMAEKLGASVQGALHEVTTPFGAPSSPVTLAEVEGVPVALIARHGAGHLLNATAVPYRANLHALKAVGVTHVLATGAVGSLRENIRPTELVVPDQVIDRTWRRIPSFFDELSVHVELASPFCAHLRNTLVAAATREHLTAHDGATYVCMEGPQLSTRAESHLHRAWGGDLIGMTAMPEAKLAREAELCYALLALPTDDDCWRTRPDDVDTGELLKEVGRNLAEVTSRALRVLRAALPEVARAAQSSSPCSCQTALDHALWFDRNLLTDDQRKRYALLLERVLRRQH